MLFTSPVALTLPYVIDRLEAVGKQVRLKFSVDPSRTEVYFSSEMFYVKLILDACGLVLDVQIAHNTDPKVRISL